MKKSLVLTLAVGLVMVLGGVAMAADSNTLTVSANVVGTCKFSSATSTLAFGALDPSVGTDVTKTPQIQFWCTKGITETVSAGNGLNFASGKRQMIGPNSDVIPYTLSLATAGTSGGPGSPKTLTITGGVLGTDYTSKSAGDYADTVALTITP